ncbi:hypothetical protein BDR03DRAFT_979754 [Suillus americanus]|nr:hypothetical protein BDR03DRAFT_979754 [Suillus americanus]
MSITVIRNSSSGININVRPKARYSCAAGRRRRDFVVHMPSLWCSIWESAETGSGQPSVVTHGSSDPEDFYKNDETKLQHVIQLFISQLSSLCVEFFPSANPELVLEHIQALQELAVRSHNNHIPIVSQSALRLPATLRSFKLVGLDLAVKRLSSLGPMIWDTQAGLAVVQAR